MENGSFKMRVAQVAIAQAKLYQEIFVNYEYLLCSDAFTAQDYYIVAAKADNYRHLIGVNTAISASDFYWKCLNGTLSEADFDFVKKNRSEKEIKGSVRRKIKSLSFLTSMMGQALVAQEDYHKNEIICSFAATDCHVTVGFVNEGKSRPKSLLWGDSLDWNKAGLVELILRRKSGDSLFSDIVFGDYAAVAKYRNKIQALAAPDLLEVCARPEETNTGG